MPISKNLPLKKTRITGSSIIIFSVTLIIFIYVVVNILTYSNYHQVIASIDSTQNTTHLYLSTETSHSASKLFPNAHPIIPASSHREDQCLYNLPIEHAYNPHLVTPPEGPVDIVCCDTTQGVINIAVHTQWAPLGAKRFLDMVESHFFDSKVPLFRALKDFLIQFGLSGDPKIQHIWDQKGSLLDDNSWLPYGPKHRQYGNITRYQEGYIAYAGGGKNSRGTQLIICLKHNLYLGGGSPWEVPFGQVIGKTSYQTLHRIYTGYHELPSQGKIMNHGLNYTMKEFPLMDYMTSCKITATNIPWKYLGTPGRPPVE